jgi:uncharacterized membrane protein
MEPWTSKRLTLGGGIAVLFVTSIAILLRVIPEPHRNLDYLVIGAVATFLSMILLWVALMFGPKE